MAVDATVMQRVTFWNGSKPTHDAAIIMTTYMAASTLHEAVQSIFAQKVARGLRVHLIMGVDVSTDNTLAVANELATVAPDWLSVEVFQNDLPGVTLGGRKTARSNFMNCYSRVRAPVVLFLNCDDAWRTDTKLASQISHVSRTGRACCTSLETTAPVLRTLNDEDTVRSPFVHGTTVLFSSFAMPYVRFSNARFWWTVPFLDLPILALCWERFGIDRLTGEVTFYRVNSGGSWSSQDKFAKYRLIRQAVMRMILFGPYAVSNKWALWGWMRRQRP